MKFRGKIIDLSCVKQFINVINTLSKLGKSCILRITPNRLIFVIKDQHGGPTLMLLKCEILQEHIFAEYLMEGVSQDFNEIYLEFPPEQMSRTLAALKSNTSAKFVKMKLTKKQTPCLTFEIEQSSLSSVCRFLIHDIPVTVIPRKQWTDYRDMPLPTFDVSLNLPPLRLLRTMVERLKNLSPVGSIECNKAGLLKVKVETDVVSATVHFDGLQISNSQSSSSEEDEEGSFYSIRIDFRKFLSFLSAEHLNPIVVKCNIAVGKILHILIETDEVVVQCFLPALAI